MVVVTGPGKADHTAVALAETVEVVAQLFFAHLLRQSVGMAESEPFGHVAVKIVKRRRATDRQHVGDILRRVG